MSSRACSGALKCSTGMAQSWGLHTLRGNNFVLRIGCCLHAEARRYTRANKERTSYQAQRTGNTDFILTPCSTCRNKHPSMSTVLAQDHFYSDFLSLSLTILTHKGSMMMIIICCGVESALASATGGMNFSTTDFLNGANLVNELCHCIFPRHLFAYLSVICWRIRNSHAPAVAAAQTLSLEWKHRLCFSLRVSTL